MTIRFRRWLQQKWHRPAGTDLDQAYQVTFSTAQGQLVLQHLLNEVYCQVCLSKDPIDLATHNGRRSLIQEILENIERAEQPQPTLEETQHATY